MIKIIKRNATLELPMTAPKKLPPTQTVTATVSDWIAESRKTRLDEASSSRHIIAGWTDADRT